MQCIPYTRKKLAKKQICYQIEGLYTSDFRAKLKFLLLNHTSQINATFAHSNVA
jgi:hypothetical protein